ncbi:MAG: hypothetical protein UV50_C0005G0037 [Parcubacteria group bacterium GW2011_GWB1_42_9]|nr:MAG: hypothetical protein UV50_C0005G0037 [Parcubacteria group bacterium GW2011_GWB1_42_9]
MIGMTLLADGPLAVKRLKNKVQMPEGANPLALKLQRGKPAFVKDYDEARKEIGHEKHAFGRDGCAGGGDPVRLRRVADGHRRTDDGPVWPAGDGHADRDRWRRSMPPTATDGADWRLRLRWTKCPAIILVRAWVQQ